MRRLLTTRLIAGTLALSWFTALASADCKRKMALKTTGLVADASGTVDARSAGGEQRLKVSADAKVADGTTLVLYIDGRAAGTITFLLNNGEAEFNNHNGGVMPNRIDACSVTTIEVRDTSNLPVLIGAF